MTTTAAPEAPQVDEPEGDDLRDALIREARRRARRRRSISVGAVVVVAVAGIAAWSMSSGTPPPPAALGDGVRPAGAGPRTAAPAFPSTTVPSVSVPAQWKASSFLLDIRTGQRSALPAGLVEGFSLKDTFVWSYLPSPDGTRVVASNWCGNNTCGDRIAVGNIDGSDVRTITPPAGRRMSEISWSPDSTKIVYRSAAIGTDNDLGELFVEDVTTGAQTQITHLERGATRGAWMVAPTFSADGQTVLFMLPKSDRCCPSDVWSVPVTGGEPTLMITDAAFPAPLPDGKTIAYLYGGLQTISVASIDDPGSARFLNPGDTIIGLGSSPDGTRLLYGLPGGPPPEDPGGLNMVDIDTGAVETVVHGAVNAGWLDNDTLIVTEITPVDD
jgi:hypothetical protein